VREGVVETGLRLHVVVRRAEACQRGFCVWVGGGTEEAAGEEEEEELVRVRAEMEAVWAEARRCQGAARKMDGARAEGLLGFGEGREEEWDEERFGMHRWTYPGKESFF
jgi:hypothetical protein